METSARPLALVTGASSGIGLELARLFAQNGFDLIVAAEDDGIHQAAREVGGQAVQVDLATHEGVDRLYASLNGRAPDAIALNAGVGLGGAFIEQDLSAILNLISLNVTSTVHLARHVIPDMVARGSGRVLFTASIAALIPGSFAAVYNASKAFDHSFAQALREELKGTGVTVTSLQPGATDTNFFHRADMEDTKVGQGKKDDPAEVAKQGFDAMMAGEDHVVAGSFMNKVQAATAHVTPDTVLAKQHRGMAEPGSGEN